MRPIRWWQFGLFGGAVLIAVTGVKFVAALIFGAIGGLDLRQAPKFVVAIFGMGFLCGLVTWAGKGLHRRIGMAGDGLVGLAVMLTFFTACMILFAPEMLGTDFRRSGLPMFGLAAVTGLIGGAWTGRDLRREAASFED